MTLNEYQTKAMGTCMPSSANFSYMFLNLIGEVGEFASKVAKAIRKQELPIHCNDLEFTWMRETKGSAYTEQFRDELKKEAGDILWQLAGLCREMGWELEDVAKKNLDKLASRKDRGVIDGSGDNR